MSAAYDVLECSTCGACCRGARDYVPLDDVDAATVETAAVSEVTALAEVATLSGPALAAPSFAVDGAAAAPTPVRQTMTAESLGALVTLRRKDDADRRSIEWGDAMQCGALVVDDVPTYRCGIYDSRPKACRDFEVGGRHCLSARLRSGVT